MKRWGLALALLLNVALVAPVGATAPNFAWLCPPNGATACQQNYSVSFIPGIGAPRVTHYVALSHTKHDCFFAYPTISPDITANASLALDPSTRRTIINFVRPFARSCRVIIPIYRQITASELYRVGLSKNADDAHLEVAYLSLRSAWRNYLATTNARRSVILIGYSQGAGLLAQLLRREIVPHAAQSQRVELAELVGGGVQIASPRSSSDGLGGMKLCGRIGSVSCVVAFDASAGEPASNVYIGRPNSLWAFLARGPGAKGDTAVCVNPVYGARQSGPLVPYFGSSPYTTYANRFRATCMHSASTQWLDIHTVPWANYGTKGNAVPSLPSDAVGSRIALHSLEWSLTVGSLVNFAHAATVTRDQSH